MAFATDKVDTGQEKATTVNEKGSGTPNGAGTNANANGETAPTHGTIGAGGKTSANEDPAIPPVGGDGSGSTPSTSGTPGEDGNSGQAPADSVTGGDAGSSTTTPPSGGDSGNTPPPEEDKTTTETAIKETVVSNAIQEAIAGALADVDKTVNSTEKTITVELANGTYAGNFTIAAQGVKVTEVIVTTITKDKDGNEISRVDGAATTKEDELYDLTSYEGYTLVIKGVDDSGDVDLDGMINIDGINVMLAGIYLSMQSGVKITNGANVTINGTKKDDTIQIFGGDAKEDGLTNQAIINGGDGNDRMIVDLSTANTVGKVIINGGDGNSDTLHFEGTANPDATGNDESTVGGTTTVQVENGKNAVLQLTAEQVENFTDAIANKKEVVIGDSDFTAEAGATTKSYAAKEAFTNYVYTTANVADFVVNGGDFLTKFIVKSDKDLTIGKLYAANVMVELEADNMTVTDAITGKTFTATGKNFTATETAMITTQRDININMSDSDKGFNQELPTVDLGSQLGDGFGETGTTEVKGSLFDVVGESTVVIKGKLNAGSDIQKGANISISVTVTQEKQLVDFALGENKFPEGVNFVNVKINRAKVDIEGDLKATGSVVGSAASKTTVKADNSGMADLFIPLATSVAVVSTEMNVTSGASITAGEDVSLGTDAQLEVISAAETGKLPVSIAVSVVVLDNNTKIEGDITAGGDVNITSDTNANVTTTAKQGKQTGKSGGFFGVAVVDTDTKAVVADTAKIIASTGDVNVKAVSKDIVNTTATAEKGEEGEGSEPVTLDAIIGFAKGILKTLTGLGEENMPQWAKDGVNGAVSTMSGKEFSIGGATVKHGSVSAPVKANKDEMITVEVSPKAGYKLTSLGYEYLEEGAAQFTQVEIVLMDGKYTFTMPNRNVSLYASFEKMTKEELAAQYKEQGAVFDGDILKDKDGKEIEATKEDKKFDSNTDKDSGAGVTDLFDQAASGTKDAEVDVLTENSPEKDATGRALSLANIALENKDEFGKILCKVSKGETGKKVAVIVNPGEGYRLVADSLKATYKDKNGATTTILITKNNNGDYILLIPTDISGNEGENTITITAAFEKGEKDKNEKSSKVQVGGAVAVGVVTNHNLASVAGDMTAGGNLNVSADGITKMTTTADSTAITAEPTSADQTFGLGVAVAVNVNHYSNRALILGGTTKTEGIDVSAISGSKDDPLVSEAVAKAGYSAGKIGIGGAVAVHVVGAETRALIYKDAKVKFTGKDSNTKAGLSVKADSYEKIITTADAENKDKVTAENFGMGAGIAVAVVGVDTIAGI
ncbi:MAG: hypothetical protein RR361_01750, partial [Anaerovorax sp.]